MVVRPSMTQCGPTFVPASMRTCGPMTAYAPTVTEESSSAAGSTSAVEWMFVMPQRPAASGRDVAHGAHQRGLDGQLVAHHGACRVLVDARLLALDARLEDQLVARLHHALEAGAVDADEVVQAL